jgi:hypothetical protein
VNEPSHGAKRINVGELRAQGLKVGWDPRPENRHHGAVWGIGIQIMDRLSAFAADGLPFVFDRWFLDSRLTGSPRRDLCRPPASARRYGTWRAHQMPLTLDIATFR